MAVLELAAVAALASACVPADMPKLRQRMVAHAVVESGLDPLAIRDNTTNVAYRPRTIDEALLIAASLRGHPLDAGIAQVTLANWEKTGLRSPRLLFSATANFCAGTIILAQDYEAACRYNTGKPNCENGYPEAVARAQATIARIGYAGDTYAHRHDAAGTPALPQTAEPSAIPEPVRITKGAQQILVFDGWSKE